MADAPAMARLREASGWAEGAGEEVMRRYLAGEHHPRHALPPRVAILAVANGELVGFVAGHRTTRFGCAGELEWILVAPARRGGPVAGRLLSELGAWFTGVGAARVCVNVAPENARARRFYTRHGAEPLEVHWMVWPDIGVAERGAGGDLRVPRG